MGGNNLPCIEGKNQGEHLTHKYLNLTYVHLEVVTPSEKFEPKHIG